MEKYIEIDHSNYYYQTQYRLHFTTESRLHNILGWITPCEPHSHQRTTATFAFSIGLVVLASCYFLPLDNLSHHVLEYLRANIEIKLRLLFSLTLSMLVLFLADVSMKMTESPTFWVKASPSALLMTLWSSRSFLLPRIMRGGRTPLLSGSLSRRKLSTLSSTSCRLFLAGERGGRVRNIAPDSYTPGRGRPYSYHKGRVKGKKCCLCSLWHKRETSLNRVDNSDGNKVQGLTGL